MEQTATTQLAVMQPSDNTQLSSVLNGLEEQLYNAARANMLQSVDPTQYTQSEIEAIVAVEQLRLVKGLDLAAIFLRRKLIRKIEEEALWSQHPNHDEFPNMATLAMRVGISKTQLTNEKTLCDIVFPYFTANLNMQPSEVFENMCRSNLTEILPILRVMITGEQSPSANNNHAALSAMDNAAATLISAATANGQPAPTTDEIRNAAITELVEHAANMTNAQIRGHVRPSAVTPINPVVTSTEGRRFIIAELDEDQWLNFQRKLGAFIGTPNYVERNVRTLPIVRTLNSI
jgi:hypothetical protein